MSYKKVGIGTYITSKNTKGHRYIRLVFDSAELWDITFDNLMRGCQVHENFHKGKGQPDFIIISIAKGSNEKKKTQNIHATQASKKMLPRVQRKKKHNRLNTTLDLPGMCDKIKN